MEGDLITYLESQGYRFLQEVPGKGLCGLYPFMFTVGLCYNITRQGYDGRYCYPQEHSLDAMVALKAWDGEADPIGNWIKHKGDKGEYSNPKYY